MHQARPAAPADLPYPPRPRPCQGPPLIAARLWLTVYQLPPYAPEFNPVEGVWSHLKRSPANLTKHSLDQLTALVKTRLKRMQYRSPSHRGPHRQDRPRLPTTVTSAVKDL
ncbi:transposase [Streptomyces avermitilis]